MSHIVLFDALTLLFYYVVDNHRRCGVCLWMYHHLQLSKT